MMGSAAEQTDVLVVLEPVAEVSDLACLADELLSEHRLVPRALPFLVNEVMSRDILREQVLMEVIERSCERFLNSAMRRRVEGERAKSSAEPTASRRSANLDRWGAAVAESLLDDFTLPNGRRLGAATREDLQHAIDAYQAIRDDATIKGGWLRLVQQGLQPGETVRSRYTEDRLKELRAMARKARGAV
jgi:hypothetical protein